MIGWSRNVSKLVKNAYGTRMSRLHASSSASAKLSRNENDGCSCSRTLWLLRQLLLRYLATSSTSTSPDAQCMPQAFCNDELVHKVTQTTELGPQSSYVTNLLSVWVDVVLWTEQHALMPCTCMEHVIIFWLRALSLTVKVLLQQSAVFLFCSAML